MSTELAPFGGVKITMKDEGALAAALSKSANDDPRAIGDGVYISFSGKTGNYRVGVDGDDMDPEELWLVNLPLSASGYICWKGGKPVEKLLARIDQPDIAPPEVDRNGPFNDRTGEGWYKAKMLVVQSLDRGITGEFTNNSVSGVSEMARLQGEAVQRLDDGEPYWPIVTFSKEQFTAQGQTNYKPMMLRQAWLSLDEVNALAACETSEEVDDLVSAHLDAVGAAPKEEAKKEEEKKPPRRRRSRL